MITIETPAGQKFAQHLWKSLFFCAPAAGVLGNKTSGGDVVSCVPFSTCNEGLVVSRSETRGKNRRASRSLISFGAWRRRSTLKHCANQDCVQVDAGAHEDPLNKSKHFIEDILAVVKETVKRLLLGRHRSTARFWSSAVLAVLNNQHLEVDAERAEERSASREAPGIESKPQPDVEEPMRKWTYPAETPCSNDCGTTRRRLQINPIERAPQRLDTRPPRRLTDQGRRWSWREVRSAW